MYLSSIISPVQFKDFIRSDFSRYYRSGASCLLPGRFCTSDCRRYSQTGGKWLHGYISPGSSEVLKRKDMFWKSIFSFFIYL
jgi:hypothetical protein